eukprot:6479153-Amphidinium_carterae.1
MLGALDMMHALGETLAFDALATLPARASITSTWFRYQRYIFVDVLLIYIQTLVLVLVGMEIRETGSAKRARIITLLLLAIRDLIDELWQLRDLLSAVCQRVRLLDSRRIPDLRDFFASKFRLVCIDIVLLLLRICEIIWEWARGLLQQTSSRNVLDFIRVVVELI